MTLMTSRIKDTCYLACFTSIKHCTKEIEKIVWHQTLLLAEVPKFNHKTNANKTKQNNKKPSKNRSRTFVITYALLFYLICVYIRS